MSSEDEGLNIILIPQLLPVIAFRLSPINELNLLDAFSDIEAFFSSKHEACSPPGTSSIFKIYGANASSNATIVNIVYEYGEA